MPQRHNTLTLAAVSLLPTSKPLYMREQILQYLAENNDGTLIPLNEKLAELSQNQPVRNLKGILRSMSEDKIVEISGDIGSLGTTHSGQEYNLSNLQISGRILDNGLRELKRELHQNMQMDLTQKQLNQTPRPFTKLLSSLEDWAMKGWRRWIAIPIFLLFFFIPLILGFIEGIGKLSSSIKEKLGTKEVYATHGEKTAFNEWIAVVDNTNNEEEGSILCKNFKEAYDRSNHSVSTNDIFCVKSDSVKGEWLVIIDAGEGKASPEIVGNYMESMKQYAESDRDTKNTLGRLIRNCYPHYYDSLKYIQLYGKIKNHGKE